MPDITAMPLLRRYLIALNRNFSTDNFNPIEASRARILIETVLDLLHFYAKFNYNDPIVFELLIKSFNFHLQADCLNLDPTLLVYSESLARKNRNNLSMHHLIAQHYQTGVRFANSRRAEPHEYKELIGAIVDFMQGSAREHFPDLRQSLAIAYMQADDCEGCISELTQLAKTSYVTQSPKKQLTVYANISTAFLALKQYTKAISYLMMVLRVHNNTSTKDPNIGFAYNNLGAIYYELEQFKNAAIFYSQSIAESSYYQNRNQYHRFAGWAFFGLARISCRYSHNQVLAESQRDKFVTNIRTIFPSGSWPKSYLDCLQKVNASITSLSLPSSISSIEELEGEDEQEDQTRFRIQARL
jgi:tetratricopeptide (TPR) repeat protein